MPRNSSGVYTLPLPDVVAGELIESDWANTSLDDIAQALTDSLDRYGRGGMLAPFLFLDGSIPAPGIAFTNAPSTGISRDSTGMHWSVGGVEVGWVGSNGITLVSGKSFSCVTPPATDASLTNKLYVDELVAGGGGDFLPTTGGTMTGTINSTNGSPFIRTNSASGPLVQAFTAGSTLRAAVEVSNLGGISAIGLMTYNTSGAKVGELTFDGTTGYINGVAITTGGGGGGAVTRIIAGTGVTISPTNGLGDVTINASGAGTGYLPLTGGTLSGNLTAPSINVTGNQTIGGTLTVSGAASAAYVRTASGSLATPAVAQTDGTNGLYWSGVSGMSVVGNGRTVARLFSQAGSPNNSTVQAYGNSSSGYATLSSYVNGEGGVCLYAGTMLTQGGRGFGLASSTADGLPSYSFLEWSTAGLRITHSTLIYPANTGATSRNPGTTLELQSAGTNQQTLVNLSAGAGKYWLQSISNANAYTINNQGGNGATLAETGTSWTFPSDATLKDIDAPVSQALDKLAAINPVYFRWKGVEDDRRKIGLLAQEVREVLPEAVDVRESDGKLLVGSTDLIPLLVAAINELSAKVERLH